jgi:tetratricopeptide (TPR) repeat protein
LLTGLLMLTTPLSLLADALSELPAAWQNRLQPVSEPDLSGAEPAARKAITQTRERLAELLMQDATEATRLAGGYGQLAALYQLSRIDTPAALCWENAHQLQPDEFRWSYYAGYLALKRGQTDIALVALQRAGELKPDYAPLDLRLAQLWLETNELDRAQVALDRASRQAGLRAPALYYLGELDLLRRDYKSAQQHLIEALELAPQASGIHYPLAQAYRHQGQQDLARQHLAEFKPGLPVADDPLVAELQSALESSRADFRIAMRAIKEQDYTSAIQRFEDGLKIDPDNLAARVSYARALYLGRQDEAALEQLNSVLERDPEQTLADFLLAVLRQSRGESDAAKKGYYRILQYDERHAGARFYLANLLFERGQYAEASKEYAAALAVNPDIPPARVLELVARQRAGMSDQEIAVALEQRITDHPEQPELKYALVRLRSLSTDQEVRDSMRALELANQLAPKQPTPPNIAALALAAAADGQFDQAARLQQQVVDMMRWMPEGGAFLRQQTALEAYEDGQMPAQSCWPADDPLLIPPPLNPEEPFRHYPAAVPY